MTTLALPLAVLPLALAAWYALRAIERALHAALASGYTSGYLQARLDVLGPSSRPQRSLALEADAWATRAMPRPLWLASVGRRWAR